MSRWPTVRIDGSRLRRLRHGGRLSADALGELVGRTPTQIYRVEQGLSGTSMELLDRLVPQFGEEAVADLIVNDHDRAAFLKRDDIAEVEEAEASEPSGQDWEALSRAVRARRRELGMGTQAALAAAARVSLNTVSRLECGMSVGVATLNAVATALEWDPARPQRILLGLELGEGAEGSPMKPVAASAAKRLDALAAAFPEDLFPDDERTPEAIRVMRRTYQHAARIVRGEA
jgi:transcriptional regulator with XRE-family HTH domain